MVGDLDPSRWVTLRPLWVLKAAGPVSVAP
jgi:hypothetical protein